AGGASDHRLAVPARDGSCGAVIRAVGHPQDGDRTKADDGDGEEQEEREDEVDQESHGASVLS
ncbi:hypothetical protein ACFU6K_30930, partial [Kitasatospora sp. NPDC057512]|uniref:hypothetical protein n=1 Tax=Kitasatospora sp. NPDC057512 TaxID=3346154 RepID=UPI0036BA1DC1